MNMTYGKTSDGNTIVIDENGNVKEINENVSEDYLLTQNKIEIIEKNINSILEEYNMRFVFFTTLATFPLFMGIVLFIPVIISKLLGFVELISNSFSIGVGGMCAVGGVLSLAIIPSEIRDRKKTIKKLEKVVEYKEELERELKKEKNEKNQTKVDAIDYVNTKLDGQKCEFISLKNKTEEMESIIDEEIFEEFYDDETNYIDTDSTDKKKVKKRKTRY